MDTPAIIALIASIGAAISGITSTIICFFTYFSTRPNLKVKIDKKHCIYTHFQNKSFALMPLSIRNMAMVDGMIGDICIKWENKKYDAEDVYTNYCLKPFKIENFKNDEIERNTNDLRLKCPLLVKGFSVIEGFVVIPNFPIIQVPSIKVRVYFRVVNKNFKRTQHITFTFATPDFVYNVKN